MNVFLLTQEDTLYLPDMLNRLMEEKPSACRMVGAAVLKGEVAAENVTDYLRLLGPRGTLLQGADFARRKLLDVLDRRLGLDGDYSVNGALRAHDVPVCSPDDINARSFREQLQRQSVDLLVSVACPQIVKKELLAFPPKGILNIHGALLPKYRGKFPSFWVLANGEEKTGVTVHYMNEALDDGPIIVQRDVPITSEDTLHTLIRKSKIEYGAPALAEALQRIAEDRVETQENDEAQATYFSFPTDEAIAAFRRSGRRVR
jgi:folate-dependent phosphoribosylglycinamide formyltransferase PurN